METNEGYQKRCAHIGCACLMQDDEDFCSEACEGANGGACPCGHLACEAEAQS